MAVAARVEDAGPDVVELAEQALGEVEQVMSPWLPRVDTRAAAGQYMRGLASMVERKNSWQLAEHAGHVGPDRFQRLLASSAWDEHGLREDVACWVTSQLADEQAVLVADETGFLKKGQKSAGVQRQYSGTAGRIENCQIGVFLAYATPAGRALVDRELYLPESWTEQPDRCAAAGIPPEMGFATKPQLARIMIERARAAGIPFGWVAADELYGDNPGLRGWLAAERIRYAMAVSCDHLVTLTDGSQARADALAADPQLLWTLLSCGDGAKGPRLYEFAEVPDAASDDHRLVIRRALDDGELAFFWCYTPGGATLAELVAVIGLRWAVEECFQAAKGQVGLDHYQVRCWTGWYRHITLAMAAHAALTVAAIRASTQGATPTGTGA